MSDKMIDKMVDKFLCWKLPEDFCPDCGITFTKFHSNGLGKYEPVGTNLFTAIQVKGMLLEIMNIDEGGDNLNEEYESLLRDSKMLETLYAAGVDNWDGYDYALQMMEEN